MDTVTRTVSEPHLVRLLGNWQSTPEPGPAAPDGVPAYIRLAGAIRALLLDARLPAGATASR